MKTKVTILILIGILLASCAPETPTQESEVIEVATEAPATEAPMAQEPVATASPTETPLACVTLLTPINGVEIPPVGKVNFSWTAIDKAGKYVLNIILPTGDVVPFETDKSTYARYMEAFVFGGEYQWQVIAQGIDGNEICVSEIAKFNKSAYQPPQNSGESGNGDGCLINGNWVCGCPPDNPNCWGTGGDQ